MVRIIVSLLLMFLTQIHAIEPTKKEVKAMKKNNLENKFWFVGKHTLKVIQNRYYKKDGRVELTLLQAGYFLKNQYIDIFSVGGSLSYYFSELWGWEIISGSYMTTRKRPEVETLENYSKRVTADGKPITADIRKPKYLLTTNIIWLPLYGKLVTTIALKKVFSCL